MFQAHQTNDILNASCLVDVIIQAFKGEIGTLTNLAITMSLPEFERKIVSSG